jgi:nitroimidazol reductase NimA-like FMN-containing flavoprotein (pyridoxamine 5'-phosphate oxidase superfamily)
MRKEKRAVRDTAAIEALVRRCHALHLGLWDGERPYAVTVNFGYEPGAVYFHCADQGRKADCIRANGLASFMCIAESELIRDAKACGFTTHYKSVTGFGRAAFLETSEDKAHGLDVIMAHHAGPVGGYEPKVLARTSVVRIAVESMLGKVNPAFDGDPQI